MSKKVLIPTKLDAIAREILEANGSYSVVQDESADLLDLAKEHTDAHALIVRNRTKVTKEVLDAAPALVCVGRLGVGLDNIDLDACKAREVAVYPATGANNLSVAEYVITQALVLLAPVAG